MGKQRIILGISGASGFQYGYKALQLLQAVEDLEVHLVISKGAEMTRSLETPYSREEVLAMADVVHPIQDLGASISSGSFQTLGMLVAPCSMRSLAAIAHGLSDNLLTRAADVCLKEYKPLILCVRETPLHLGHLRLMTQAAEIGARIVPLMPAFYHRPQTVDDIINQGVNRLLDQLDISLEQDLFERWQGNK